MARHRHVVSVRSDGLSVVLEPFVKQRQVIAATLVDTASGMVLDGFAVEDDAAFIELMAATHAELMRLVSVFVAGPGSTSRELTISLGGDVQHLLRAVPDPHGDQLVLSVIVRGTPWQVGRAWKQLRAVSAEALTAGPTNTRRPVNGQWELEAARPDKPVEPSVDAPPVVQSWFTRDGQAVAGNVRRSELPRRIRPARDTSATTPDTGAPQATGATHNAEAPQGTVATHESATQRNPGVPSNGRAHLNGATVGRNGVPANGAPPTNGAHPPEESSDRNGLGSRVPPAEQRPERPVRPALPRVRSSPAPPTAMPPRRRTP